MKRILFLLAVLLVFGGGYFIASASESDLPDDVSVFHVEDKTCILWPDGTGECWCSWECEDSCDVPKPIPTATPTKQRPNPTNTPEPTATPEPTPTLEPTEKPKCNRGLGNGPEGCDPGNSGGKPGKAGEDDG